MFNFSIKEVTLIFIGAGLVTLYLFKDALTGVLGGSKEQAPVEASKTPPATKVAAPVPAVGNAVDSTVAAEAAVPSAPVAGDCKCKGPGEMLVAPEMTRLSQPYDVGLMNGEAGGEFRADGGWGGSNADNKVLDCRGD